MSHKLTDVLSEIGELGSPQVNLYKESSPYSKLLALAFRFSDKEVNRNQKYFHLMYIIDSYQGKTKWVLHKSNSRKNLIIEPLEFYYIRRKFDMYCVAELEKHFGQQEFRTLMDDYIFDSENLADYILEEWQKLS